MRYFISILLGVLFFGNINAQVGIKGGYRTFSNDDWETKLSEAFNDEFSTATGWSVGINYWFRLKKRRIEFTPEITIGEFQETTSTGFDRKHNFQSFHFNTNIYLFDLAEDCDCPVWSKDGSFLTKGFFVQLSPGISRMTNSLGGELLYGEDTNFHFEFGIGGGIDFGVSDFLTITPMVKFFYSPNTEWNELAAPDGTPSLRLEGIGQQLFAGIKFSFRFDEL